MFPDKLRVSSFPDRFQRCSNSGIVSPLRLRWVNGACVFRCNLPLALLAEQPGSFTCCCGNTAVEQTSNKSQHTKVILEKNILLPLLPGFELATFRSQVWRFCQTAIPAPKNCPMIFFFLYTVLKRHKKLVLDKDLPNANLNSLKLSPNSCFKSHSTNIRSLSRAKTYWMTRISALPNCPNRTCFDCHIWVRCCRCYFLRHIVFCDHRLINFKHNTILHSSRREIKIVVQSQTLKHN